ncbi:MAG: elongation factor P [candidate division WOR-3 bacterium]
MADIRKGIAIRYKNEPYLVLDFRHVHKANDITTYSIKVKHLRTGNVYNLSVKRDEPIEEITLEKHSGIFSYKLNEDTYVFFDNQTYEEIHFNKSDIENAIYYLKEGLEIFILYVDEKPVGIELPNFVELEVIETEPNFKGDTVAGGGKPATLETGKVIKVPYFIEVGDIIKVDTREDKYIERVEKK